MSTLRELIESKQRRRMAVPILVSDPSEDHEIWLGITVSIESAKHREDDSAIQVLQAQLEEATERFQSHWATVELQALPSETWELVSQVWRTEVDRVAGDDGIDWPNALAPLLAESCVDPDLQDAEWWREQLARPEWSEGDRDSLKIALLRLNVAAVDPHIPKG